MTAGIAIREPSSLVEVSTQCESIETWAETCDNIPALRDAANRLAAIDEYVARTSMSGRARVAAAMRRLEVRIGSLLGPAAPNGKSGSVATDPSDEVLSRDQRSEFRQMAEHPEVVEEVIAESTDQKPASRRSVMERLREAAQKHPVEPAPFKSQAAIKARVAKAKEMAEAGYTSSQIAEAIGITAGSMSEFRERHGVEVPADLVVRGTRNHDSNRIIEEMCNALEAAVTSAGIIRIADLDPDQTDEWVASLTNSIRSLNRFIKQIKETTL